MNLGEIVKEIVSNSNRIRCLVGQGAGDPRYEANTPMRHEFEKRQEELYSELDRREESYQR